MCVKRATVLGRPVPQHNMCLHCPSARRSSVHLPRLVAARNQAQQLYTITTKAGPVPKLQQLALTGYLTELDQLITELDTPDGSQ